MCMPAKCVRVGVLYFKTPNDTSFREPRRQFLVFIIKRLNLNIYIYCVRSRLACTGCILLSNAKFNCLPGQFLELLFISH